MKEKKQKTPFQKFLILYAVCLSLLMIIFLIYVGNSLVKYENNQTENYLKNTIEDLKTTEINNLSTIKKSQWEKENINNEEILKKILKDSENITYQQQENTKEDHPTFHVLYKKKPVLEITLKEKKKLHRLGLLTFSVWETENVSSIMEEGLYDYTFEVPSTYQIKINEKELTTEDRKKETENEGLLEISKYVEIPTLVTYEIKGLLEEPTIEITDKSGNNIEYKKEDGKITKELNFQKIATLEEAKEKIENMPEILKMAKDWSLFLSKDLTGPKHGYNTISNYLIEGSYLSKYAYSWATGVDITFTSSHTLSNPPFTNELVENFEIYNENAFSCEVYLIKHMIIKGNKKLDDTMHDRMYFVRINGEWKLVNMEAMTEGENQNE